MSQAVITFPCLLERKTAMLVGGKIDSMGVKFTVPSRQQLEHPVSKNQTAGFHLDRSGLPPVGNPAAAAAALQVGCVSPAAALTTINPLHPPTDTVATTTAPLHPMRPPGPKPLYPQPTNFPTPGKIYSVSASPFFGGEAPSREGLLRGEVSVAFTCNPADRDSLVAMSLEVVEELQTEGPTAEEVETVRCGLNLGARD
jgi:hypothetical protein